MRTSSLLRAASLPPQFILRGSSPSPLASIASWVPPPVAAPVGSPTASRRSMLLPFSGDPQLRADYLNPFGMMRVGLLFEDLDAVASVVAHAHCFGDNAWHIPGRPALVTASFEAIELLAPLHSVAEDLELTGEITSSGASSLNIDLSLTKRGVEAPLLLASTTFCLRSVTTGAAMPVPPLIPTSPAEAARFEGGRKAQAARKVRRGEGVDRLPPTPAESSLLQALHLHAGGAAVPPLPMAETGVSSVELTLPQSRNMHGAVFGGWVMRRAFESAFVCAWMYAKSSPVLEFASNISFVRPVLVGQVLKFHSSVDFVKVDESLFVVSVVASLEDPETGAAGGPLTTNTLSFVFKTARPVREVLPVTYAESLRWVSGRRLLSSRVVASK